MERDNMNDLQPTEGHLMNQMNDSVAQSVLILANQQGLVDQVLVICIEVVLQQTQPQNSLVNYQQCQSGVHDALGNNTK